MARIRKADNDIASAENGMEKRIEWRIAVYIRLSKEDGNAQSESVVNQKKILIEYLETVFKDQYTIADFYVDDGLTGTDDTRADFSRMIHDIENGKINCILCKTLSRAFRNYSDQGYYLEYYFPQKNVRFISTGDPKIDTYKNPEAITGLEVPITGLMNDRFAGRTSSDVRRTFNTKRRKGEFIGAFPPYGYLKDPKDKNHLILDNDIVPVKKDMMDWIIHDGISLSGVAQKLNDLGIPNPTAYKRSLGWNYNNPNVKQNDGLWSGSTVKRVLLDKVNLGHMVQGKQRVISYKVHEKVAVPEDEWFFVCNTHEPTFTQQEYDTLTRVLQRDTRTPNGKQSVYLFSGFLRCADCGKALHRRSAKGFVYYACRTYTEKSKVKCSKHSIRADLLEAAVLAAIQVQISLLDSLVDLMDDINKSPAEDMQSIRMEKLLGDKMRELEKVQSASDSLYLDWKTGEITREDYHRMRAMFDEKIAQLNTEMGNIKEERRQIRSDIHADNVILEELRSFRNVQRLDRNLLIEFVDAIYVHKVKEITIVFRFKDDLERILDIAEQNYFD